MAEDVISAVRRELGLTYASTINCQHQLGLTSENHALQTDRGRIFIKSCKTKKSLHAFKGEHAGLTALKKTGAIKVPEPIQVIDCEDAGSALVLEYIDMTGMSAEKEGQLGEQMARLHLHNATQRAKVIKGEQSIHHDQELSFIDKFGFHTATGAGNTLMVTAWQDDWMNYFATLIDDRVNILQQQYSEKEVVELWGQLQRALPSFFVDVSVTPALLHGDLWAPNTGIDRLTEEPVIFDPASFYGHSEFDLATSLFFVRSADNYASRLYNVDAGFGSDFYDSYHTMIPKAPGFERRIDLYTLFYDINRWNHFDDLSFRPAVIDAMHKLLGI